MQFPLPESEKRSAAIYCLVCYPTGDTYIGSTIDLHNRYQSHRCLTARNKSKLYSRLRELGFENFVLEVISRWDGDSIEMREAEAAIIKERKPTLNTITLSPNYKHKALSGEDALQYYVPDALDRKIRAIAADKKRAKAFRKDAGISLTVFNRMRYMRQGNLANIEAAIKQFKKQSRRQASS